MKKFRTTLFNGYQKNAVDDYLEDLMREMDELRVSPLTVSAHSWKKLDVKTNSSRSSSKSSPEGWRLKMSRDSS